MAKRDEVIDYLHTQLDCSSFGDSAENGLQIEGRDEILKVAVGVDAGLSVAQLAVEAGADMLVVHHGIFWGKPIPICGAHREKVEFFLTNKLNLAAYHLPLDAHPVLGNNACLAQLLKVDHLEPAFEYHGQPVGFVGSNIEGLTFKDYQHRLSGLIGYSTASCFEFGPRVPKKVGIVSGGGADALYLCRKLGVDTLISGEPKQFSYHFAKEEHLNVIFAGHYATETLGVQELGKALEQKFGVSWEFINEPTGI